MQIPGPTPNQRTQNSGDGDGRGGGRGGSPHITDTSFLSSKPTILPQ